MINFTLAQKQDLANKLQAGISVIYVSYDPDTVIGTPEQDATGMGYAVYYREDNPGLAEIIYTK